MQDISAAVVLEAVEAGVLRVMAIEAKLFQLALLLAVIGVNKAAPGRIVQLVAGAWPVLQCNQA